MLFLSIEVALVNSYILYKSASATITHLGYRRAIINSFTSAYLQNITATSHRRSRLYPVESAERLDNRKHFLGKRQTSDQHDCTICSTCSK